MSTDLGKITSCYTVTFNRRSNHSRARLWRAITAPDEVSEWMEGPAKIDLRVGGDWFVDFSAHPNSEGDGDALTGVIIRVDPDRILAYAWGMSVVEWTIEDAEDGCTYKFVQTGLADRGEGEEGLAAGWHAFFEHLDAHLDGRPFDAEAGTAIWEDLKSPYREMLDAALPQRTGA